MAKPEKVAAVAEIVKNIKESEAVVLTEYRGLTVAQLKELRRSLGADASYTVVKNKLAAIAFKEVGIDAFDGQLAGPNAIAFIKGETVSAAKSITDFAKANSQLVIKTGIFEGNTLDSVAISELAALESREFQLSKVAGVLKAPMSKFVRTVDALREKLAAEQGISSDTSEPVGEKVEASGE